MLLSLDAVNARDVHIPLQGRTAVFLFDQPAIADEAHLPTRRKLRFQNRLSLPQKFPSRPDAFLLIIDGKGKTGGIIPEVEGDIRLTELERGEDSARVFIRLFR